MFTLTRSQNGNSGLQATENGPLLSPGAFIACCTDIPPTPNPAGYWLS
jgi:hypothetical protein